MEFLIAMSTTLAYTSSVLSYAYQLRHMPSKANFSFEALALLVNFDLLGRLVNEFARLVSAKWVSFQSHQPKEALLVASGSVTRKIDARLLQYGDQFEVPPYTRIVTDGFVTHGGSEVDESLITGESIYVAKGVDSLICAGTKNKSGFLTVKVTALPHENSIHRIEAMTKSGKLTKPRIQEIAEEIAKWFVAAIAAISAAAFFVWFIVAYHREQEHPWKDAFTVAITYVVASIAVACPYAISLAIPMVVMIVRGVSARFGIIFRDPRILEQARRITDIVFEKTGTLTCGLPTVVSEEYHGSNETRTKGLLLGLLKDIKHPMFASIFFHLEHNMAMDSEKKIKVLQVFNVTSAPGEGVRGICANRGHDICAGNSNWLKFQVEETATSVICVSIGGVLSATFKLIDRPRNTAEMVVDKLQARNIKVHIVSGDNQGAVDDTAHSLNIPKRYTKSCCTTDAKIEYIKSLQKSGSVVMFVGDGTNSAAVLNQADIGVQFDQDSDVAPGDADVVLMTPRLHNLLIMLNICRDAYSCTLINFCWSIFYNVSAIPLAAGVLVPVKARGHIRIPPQWAGLGVLVGVLPVVLVAFSLRWRNYGKRFRDVEYDYLRTVRVAS